MMKGLLEKQSQIVAMALMEQMTVDLHLTVVLMMKGLLEKQSQIVAMALVEQMTVDLHLTVLVMMKGLLEKQSQIVAMALVVQMTVDLHLDGGSDDERLARETVSDCGNGTGGADDWTCT